MKNKNIIIIAVIVIVLLGGGLFFVMNKTSQPPQIPDRGTPPSATNDTNIIQNNNNGIEQIEGTLKSLLAGGKSVSCTFSNNEKDVAISGTVYTSNGKVRQDYQADTTAGKMTGHMILLTPDAYMWTDQMPQGFKFSIEGQPSPAAQGNNSRPDINKSMRFSCQPWNADNSVFTLPSNIDFQTMTIPVIPTSGAAGGTSTDGGIDLSSQCAVCNNIPAGAARDSCKQSLKCP